MRHRESGRRRLHRFAPFAAVLGMAACPAAAGAATPAPTPCPATGTAPCYTVAPTIAPATEVAAPPEGRILTASTGTWTPSTAKLSQRWQACDAATGLTCTDIPGATARTYKVAPTDVGSRLQLVMTAVAPGATGFAVVQTGVVVPAVPINRAAPRISGVAQTGQTLTGASGTWDGTMPISYAYQWRRCDTAGGTCRSIPGAAAITYVVAAADVGHTLREFVTATNSVGSASVHSFATAVVTQASSGPPPGGGSRGKGGSHGPVTAAQIRALLERVLAAHGKGATIGALLKHGGYTFAFAAPSAGRLLMSWYRVPKHGKKTLVASVNFMFHKAGTARLKLVLTRKGRRLLSSTSKIKLVAQGGFTPSGQGATRVTKRITLQRRSGKA